MPEDERHKKKVKSICQSVQFNFREDFNGRHHGGEGFTQNKKYLITGHWSIFGECVRNHAEGEPRGDLPRFQGQTCGACLKAWDDFELRFQGACGRRTAEVEEVVIKGEQHREPSASAAGLASPLTSAGRIQRLPGRPSKKPRKDPSGQLIPPPPAFHLTTYLHTTRPGLYIEIQEADMWAAAELQDTLRGMVKETRDNPKAESTFPERQVGGKRFGSKRWGSQNWPSPPRPGPEIRAPGPGWPGMARAPGPGRGGEGDFWLPRGRVPLQPRRTRRPIMASLR